MLNRIAFIGGGVMAEAIARGLLGKGLVKSTGMTIAEPIEGRRATLEAQYGFKTTSSNAAAVVGADVVVLAVKPQHAAAALADLEGRLEPNQTFLSIAAGVTAGRLSEALRHQAIVRVMPNSPAQIGEGMSVWMATPAVTSDGIANAKSILQCLGRETQVADEKYLDMATGVSGSGPGFVFLLLEAMIDAAVHLGFARPAAEMLVYQTVIGSTLMARDSDKHLAELRNLVTSPGGTTAAGIFELEEGRVRAAIDRAIFAAYRRSVDLGR